MRQIELNLDPPEDVPVCPECYEELEIDDQTRMSHWCYYKCPECGWSEKIDTSPD